MSRLVLILKWQPQAIVSHNQSKQIQLLPIYKSQSEYKIVLIFSLPAHNACISFSIPKRQAISTDTSFEIKMMVKIYAIEIIFRSHEPFQSYLLTGQA